MNVTSICTARRTAWTGREGATKTGRCTGALPVLALCLSFLWPHTLMAAPEQPDNVWLSRLKKVSGDREMLKSFRDRATNYMNQLLDVNMQGYIDAYCDDDGNCVYCAQLTEEEIKHQEEQAKKRRTEVGRRSDDDPVCMPTMDQPMPRSQNQDGTKERSNREQKGTRARDYTETNNQVADVDEADFIKTDGEYIYALSASSFSIVRAWPPEDAHIVSTVKIEGVGKELFVFSERVIIYTSRDPLPRVGYNQGYDCTYGYDCDFAGDGHAVGITVLDISNREKPEVVRELTFNGSLLTARRIDEIVFSVIYTPWYSFNEILPQFETFPQALYQCGIWSQEVVKAKFDVLRARNKRLINTIEADNWAPTGLDRLLKGGEQLRHIGTGDLHVSQMNDGNDLLSIVAFDLTTSDRAEVATVFGRPGPVYASMDGLYIASRHRRNDGSKWFWADSSTDVATAVHGFALSAQSPLIEYHGSGVAKGHVLNQFAMDEYDGHLRIATTTGHVPDPNVHSTITVFEKREESLKTVGVIDNIAPGEDIRSARFDAAKGFIVTFKKTDPLFTLDLSDPREPVIKGELKIPGFSTYMHVMDDNHLLSIGFDAEDHGNFAYFQGIILQVFDITDLSNPMLVHKETIGTRGTTSEGATNHLGFTFMDSRDLLAIPMVVCEGGQGGQYGANVTFNGLLVYKVTVEDGFESMGGLPHFPSGGQESLCNNWWTNPNSFVKRSIFMEDYVYSIARSSIRVAHIGDLSAILSTIALPN